MYSTTQNCINLQFNTNSRFVAVSLQSILTTYFRLNTLTSDYDTDSTPGSHFMVKGNEIHQV